MKLKQIYFLMALGMMLLSGCTKEEGELEPSGIEVGYTVPQGNHDFDATIVNYFNRFESYLLYDFTEKDAYWTPTAWKNGYPSTDDQNGRAGMEITMPDLDYIAPQLDLLDKTWFSLYPDNFLKEYLPRLILLCDDVRYYNINYWVWPWTYEASSIYAISNYQNICVSYANVGVETMTAADTLAFASAVNNAFLSSMISRDKLEPTDEFISSANYTNAKSLYTNSASWAYGIFQPYYEASATNDWENFVRMMMVCSEDYLNREVSYVNDYDYSSSAWEGLFTSLKDTNGLLKQRYTIVRNYFIDNYGFDLQEVGNKVGAQ